MIGATEAATFYNNVIVFNGADECAAYNHEAGSMGAWGGPEGPGFAYCRLPAPPCALPADPHGSCDPLVNYHIYVCDTAGDAMGKI